MNGSKTNTAGGLGVAASRTGERADTDFREQLQKNTHSKTASKEIFG